MLWVWLWRSHDPLLSAAVFLIVSHVPIDLSKYALDILGDTLSLLDSPGQGDAGVGGATAVCAGSAMQRRECRATHLRPIGRFHQEYAVT